MKKLMYNLSLVLSIFMITGLLTQACAQKEVKEVRKTKTGMSHKAKDALIGGGAGAVAGGVIGHGVKGAAIGGAVGAGTGYLVGRHQDKKHPYRKKTVVYKRKVN